VTDEIVIGGDAEDIPPGTYPGALTGTTVRHSDKFDSDFRVWTFQLDSGSVVEGSSSMHTSSRSKGGRWIAALLGRVPEKGEKPTLIGCRALVSVILGDDGWPKVGEVIAEPRQSAQDAPRRPLAANTEPKASPGELDF
jgi:hypothetical protein